MYWSCTVVVGMVSVISPTLSAEGRDRYSRATSLEPEVFTYKTYITYWTYSTKSLLSKMHLYRYGIIIRHILLALLALLLSLSSNFMDSQELQPTCFAPCSRVKSLTCERGIGVVRQLTRPLSMALTWPLSMALIRPLISPQKTLLLHEA